MNYAFAPDFKLCTRRGRDSKMLFLQRNKKLVAATTQALRLVSAARSPCPSLARTIAVGVAFINGSDVLL